MLEVGPGSAGMSHWSGPVRLQVTQSRSVFPGIRLTGDKETLIAVVPWKARWPLPSLGVGSVLSPSSVCVGIDLEKSSRVG